MSKFVFWSKILSLSVFCALNIFLFVICCRISLQEELAKQHVMFREVMPTMDSWINSPFGKLKSYLFNVTNAEAFLNGTDSRIRLEQVGPITYQINGYNEILNRTEDSITYRKHRYHNVTFLPDESVSPDILNRTIIQFNNVILGAAAMYRNSFMIPFFTLDPVISGENLFLDGSIYYFLWEFTRSKLKYLSQILPLSSNCGPLHNALMEKEEVFTVNIGSRHGIPDFFRIQTLNNRSLISERARSTHYEPSCPINVTNAHDNSLFPPLLHKDTPLNIMASESCRILPMHYQREQVFDGMTGYRYSLLDVNETAPKCMETTYGVPLPSGMFDVSSCVINNAPSAFSAPHFYGSSYNWSEHFEGLTPNAEDHEPFILLEPTTGIPINERYRFQSNIILPNMDCYGDTYSKVGHMIVPTFWYEFEMGHLPGFVLALLKAQVYWVPVIQKILMVGQLALATWCFLSILRRWFGVLTYGQLFRRLFDSSSSIELETVLNQQPQHDPEKQNSK